MERAETSKTTKGAARNQNVAGHCAEVLRCNKEVTSADATKWALADGNGGAVVRQGRGCVLATRAKNARERGERRKRKGGRRGKRLDYQAG